MIIYLPWPPSINRYYRAINGRNILSREGRAWKERVAAIVRERGLPMFPAGTKLEVSIHAFPPDKRKRDLDNLFKPTLDALQGFVFDDDGNIDRLTIDRTASDKLVKSGMIVVTIDKR